MKKQNIGFAFLLFGLIFSVMGVALLCWIGLLFGIIGLVIVIVNAKDNN